MTKEQTPNVGKKRGRPAAPREVYCPSVGSLAYVFDCSEKTIERSIAAGAPGKGPNGYDAREWVAWWSANVFGRSLAAGAGGDVTGDDLAAYDARKKAADAQIAEEKLKALRGRLVDRAQADAEKAQLVQRLIGILSRLSMELSVKLAGRSVGECKRIIVEHVNRERREWASAVRKGG